MENHAIHAKLVKLKSPQAKLLYCAQELYKASKITEEEKGILKYDIIEENIYLFYAVTQ